VLLRVRGEAARRECVESIAQLTSRLAAEVSEQREMADLEAGRFQARLAYVSTSQVRELIGQFFAGQEVASGKRLTLGSGDDDLVLRTDLVLLQRALVNLVKNALEATPAGGEVRIWHEPAQGRVTFAVWNAGAMAPTTALRVFQRYFTTKGERGRGLGTYGAKLIVERCLGGHVSFTTTEAEGTTFRIELPRDDSEPACHTGRKDSPH
jgi:signal transduction histidine kinase